MEVLRQEASAIPANDQEQRRAALDQASRAYYATVALRPATDHLGRPINIADLEPLTESWLDLVEAAVEEAKADELNQAAQTDSELAWVTYALGSLKRVSRQPGGGFMHRPFLLTARKTDSQRRLYQDMLARKSARETNR